MLKSMKVSLALLAATFSFLAFSNAAVADGKIAVVNI
jgi:hypothetical protein